MRKQSTHLIFGEGANFKLKIRKVDGYWNYDKSEFEGASKVKDTDEQIEELWKKQLLIKRVFWVLQTSNLMMT